MDHGYAAQLTFNTAIANPANQNLSEEFRGPGATERWRLVVDVLFGSERAGT